MQDTQTSFHNTTGAFPNIIFKKKLMPLPLFHQNRSPKSFSCKSPTLNKTMFGFKTSSSGFNSPVRTGPSKLPRLNSPTPGSPNQAFLNELKTVNNYGRLCDQPFIEFSSFHFQQVFGSGDGKKKVQVDPSKRRENKRKITKIGTLEDSTSLRSPIRIQNNVEVPKPRTSHRKIHEHKDNYSVIKKAYQIGQYEAIIGFYSLEILMVPVADPNEDRISVRLGRDELKKVYKYPHHQIVNTVSSSLTKKDGKILLNISKDKSLKSDLYTDGETYPEKKEGLKATIDGKEYNATIFYPYLEVTIKEVDYYEKMMLRPSYLSNLFAEQFDNLQDYVQKFGLPPQIYKDKDEIHNDNLKAIPSIVKRVLKNAEFGGLMLFKSIEVNLKNTSDIEPETIMTDSTLTPIAKNILKKRKKDVNIVQLRVDVADLNKLTKASAEEISELIQNSIIIEEGKGFTIKLDEHKTLILNDRKHIKNDSLPEYSDKFSIRFNRFLYEGFIKFPTLELYVPETNFKDVIQLKPSELQELIKAEFQNMQDFLPKFRKPTNLIQHTETEPEENPQETVQEENVAESPNEGKVFTFQNYSININN